MKLLGILRASQVAYKGILHYPEIDIQKDGATFIVGASGCGKSTLLRLFNATESPDEGNIFYEGKDLEEWDTISLRQQVVLVGQSVYLFDGTVKDNFREFYSYRQEELIAEEKMSEFLSLCCADFSLDAPCGTMSGGEQQRVYLAIFLSLVPRVLMLDEPTSALDSTNADKLLANVKNFCRERQIAMLIVSHDKALTEKYADAVIAIERGV